MEVQQGDNSSKVYFANLDALRFFAASAVLINHIESRKLPHGLATLINKETYTNIGAFAVTFFFVLSGFLITYLLLKEKETTDTINIRSFYMRRILRIWPLYYLVVLTGIFIIPHIPIFDEIFVPDIKKHIGTGSILLYILLLPNFVAPKSSYIGQTWSIGVEEQFYLIWPLFLVSKTSLKKLIIFIVVSVLLSRILMFSDLYSLNDSLQKIRFGCLGIGGIGAFLLLRKQNYAGIMSFFLRKEVQFITLFYSLYFLKGIYILGFTFAITSYLVLWTLRKRNISILSLLFIALFMILILLNADERIKIMIPSSSEVLSVFFCIIIINMACAETSIINFKNRVILYLGKISYGIYMYHNLTVILVMNILVDKLHLRNDLAVYCASFLLTILVSALSYELFEKFFLSLKKKFSIIKSGNN